MRWEWDDRKSVVNKKKHGLSFSTAILVFDDPLAATRRDRYLLEERWQTIGMIGGVVILVVHTAAKRAKAKRANILAEESGRIISARKATPRERRNYENGEF